MTPDQLMSHILEKLDRLDSRLDEQGQTLVRLTQTVEIHERRSTTLEAEFAPVKQHVVLAGVIGKGIVAACAGAITVFGFLKSMGWF